ncbi:hypothetical protein GCM10009665_11870 [Kitasatospora nipponensis]|uniref:Uncharacterized protein n=1 Tax=Kitasatospora nipponensis TaxID=258049 RepID=A0ABN1VU85_9ACTN
MPYATARYARRTLGALGIFTLGVLAQVVHALVFDQVVVEPTRHCHRAAAVPFVSYLAGFVVLGLTAATVVAVVRALGRHPRGGGAPAHCCLAVLVLLLFAAALLMLFDAAALHADFDPGELDPFHCGQ